MFARRKQFAKSPVFFYKQKNLRNVWNKSAICEYYFSGCEKKIAEDVTFLEYVWATQKEN